jgi:D-lactate dehydrogenase (cytochrome)
MGGSVSAEHGIGKIKRAFLPLMYGIEGVGEMLDVKKTFDQEMRLNPGTLFDVS